MEWNPYSWFVDAWTDWIVSPVEREDADASAHIKSMGRLAVAFISCMALVVLFICFLIFAVCKLFGAF